MTCWRRLRDWQQTGVWDRLHQLLLAELRDADQLDFSAAAWTRSVSKPSVEGTDGRKPGRPRHITSSLTVGIHLQERWSAWR